MLLFVLSGGGTSRADTHIYAGALGTNQNAPLFFPNGILFDAARTNFAFPQMLRTNGPNQGHYRGDVLTFTGTAGAEENGGPASGHAALGSRLAVQVVSVTGPPEGRFSFWESDGEFPLPHITFSVPVGTANGTNHVVISENQGEPGGDPYGHIHGRAFTGNVPGTYIVGFRLLDLSTNGTGGGPIHQPSAVLFLRFQAGLRIEAMQLLPNRVSVSFRSLPGISNVLEATGSVGPGAWTIVAGPLRGNHQLQSLAETNAPEPNRFYRVRTLNHLP